MKLIEARNLKGFRDYLPKDQIPRQHLLANIRKIFELFGFEPLETPVLEYEEILTGKYGREGEQLMYRFKDQGNRNVAMRYDLTVPLARVVAQYAEDLPRPFKRYQIAPVWRAENTQKGRYREFYQCDVDIIGAAVGIADAECVAVVEAALKKLGIKKFIIKVNNRKILNATVLACGVPEAKMLPAIRTLDKLDKIGVKAVATELEEKVNLKISAAENLISLVSTKISSIAALENFVNKYLSAQPQGREGCDEMSAVFRALRQMGVKNAVIDLSLARGLDYYTATIFETIVTESPACRSYGSVAGGGRYDRLVNLFTGKDLPAVGVSLGIDRLFALMRQLNLKTEQSVVSVLIMNMDQKFQEDYLIMARALRQAGINSEVYYQPVELKKQFAFAEKKNIPLAILFADNEARKKNVLVRNLKTRKQSAIKLNSLVKGIKKILK